MEESKSNWYIDIAMKTEKRKTAITKPPKKKNNIKQINAFV